MRGVRVVVLSLLGVMTLEGRAAAPGPDLHCMAGFRQHPLAMERNYTVTSAKPVKEVFVDESSDLAALYAYGYTQKDSFLVHLRTWTNWGIREVSARGNTGRVTLSLERPGEETGTLHCYRDNPPTVTTRKLACKVTFFMGSPLHDFELSPGASVEDLPMKGFHEDQGYLSATMTEVLVAFKLRHYDGNTLKTRFVNEVQFNAETKELEIVSDSFGGTHRIYCKEQQ